jgi:hypothetical protein
MCAGVLTSVAIVAVRYFLGLVVADQQQGPGHPPNCVDPESRVEPHHALCAQHVTETLATSHVPLTTTCTCTISSAADVIKICLQEYLVRYISQNR